MVPVPRGPRAAELADHDAQLLSTRDKPDIARTTDDTVEAPEHSTSHCTGSRGTLGSGSKGAHTLGSAAGKTGLKPPANAPPVDKKEPPATLKVEKPFWHAACSSQQEPLSTGPKGSTPADVEEALDNTTYVQQEPLSSGLKGSLPADFQEQLAGMAARSNIKLLLFDDSTMGGPAPAAASGQGKRQASVATASPTGSPPANNSCGSAPADTSSRTGIKSLDDGAPHTAIKGGKSPARSKGLPGRKSSDGNNGQMGKESSAIQTTPPADTKQMAAASKQKPPAYGTTKKNSSCSKETSGEPITTTESSTPASGMSLVQRFRHFYPRSWDREVLEYICQHVTTCKPAPISLGKVEITVWNIEKVASNTITTRSKADQGVFELESWLKSAECALFALPVNPKNLSVRTTYPPLYPLYLCAITSFAGEQLWFLLGPCKEREQDAKEDKFRICWPDTLLVPAPRKPYRLVTERKACFCWMLRGCLVCRTRDLKRW